MGDNAEDVWTVPQHTASFELLTSTDGHREIYEEIGKLVVALSCVQGHMNAAYRSVVMHHMRPTDVSLFTKLEGSRGISEISKMIRSIMRLLSYSHEALEDVGKILLHVQSTAQLRNMLVHDTIYKHYGEASPWFGVQRQGNHFLNYFLIETISSAVHDLNTIAYEFDIFLDDKSKYEKRRREFLLKPWLHTPALLLSGDRASLPGPQETARLLQSFARSVPGVP